MSREGALGVAQGRPIGGIEPGGIQHEAFLYHGDAGFLGATRDFVLAGLAAGEAVLVAVPPPRIRQLREALGRAAERVAFVDVTDLGRNPARIIPAWQDFLDSGVATGRPVRGVGEPMWPGRSEPERRECVLHEALLNQVFAAPPAWRLRCPYDAAALDPATVDEVWRTHPFVVDGGVGQISARFRPAADPTTVLAAAATAAAATATAATAIDSGADPGADRGWAPAPRGDGDAWPPRPDAPAPESLPDLGEPRIELAFGPDDLGRIRAMVSLAALARGLGPERSGEFELAVHEIATNSVRHGGGHGTARLWIEAGGLICEVSDRGWVRDPLAGRRRPDLAAGGGRGLWLVNQLCDLVQLRSSPAGTTVRLYMYAA